MKTAKLFTIILLFAVQMFCIARPARAWDAHAPALAPGEVMISFAPKQIVSIIYAQYLANPRGDKGMVDNLLEIIYPYVTHSLRQAIDREVRWVPGAPMSCFDRLKLDKRPSPRELSIAIKNTPVCQFREWRCELNIIINGYEWNLSGFSMTEVAHDRNRATIRTDFINDGRKNEVTYFLVLENRQWKIADIKAISFTKNDTIESSQKFRERLLK